MAAANRVSLGKGGLGELSGGLEMLLNPAELATV